MAVQDTINTLLGEYVALGDSTNLGRLLGNGFLPSSSVDLITQGAGIGTTGDGRDAVLSVLIQYGVT
jgi:hypothetical protein